MILRLLFMEEGWGKSVVIGGHLTNWTVRNASLSCFIVLYIVLYSTVYSPFSFSPRPSLCDLVEAVQSLLHRSPDLALLSRVWKNLHSFLWSKNVYYASQCWIDCLGVKWNPSSQNCKKKPVRTGTKRQLHAHVHAHTFRAKAHCKMGIDMHTQMY